MVFSSSLTGTGSWGGGGFGNAWPTETIKYQHAGYTSSFPHPTSVSLITIGSAVRVQARECLHFSINAINARMTSFPSQKGRKKKSHPEKTFAQVIELSSRGGVANFFVLFGGRFSFFFLEGVCCKSSLPTLPAARNTAAKIVRDLFIFFVVVVAVLLLLLMMFWSLFGTPCKCVFGMDGE